MKRILMFAAFASTLLVSCSSEELIPTKESEASRKELSFTVGVVNSPTKAGIINDASFNDINTRIGMFVLNSTAGETNYTNAEFKISKFKPAIKKGLDGVTDIVDPSKPWVNDNSTPILLTALKANVYAFYPYADVADVSKVDKNVKVNVKSTSLSFLGSDQNDYMYATAEKTGDGTIVPFAYPLIEVNSETGKNTAKLFFHHALAKLTFRIKMGDSYVKPSAPITSIILSNTVDGHQFSKTTDASRMSLVSGVISPLEVEHTLTFQDTGVTFNANPTTNAAGKVTKAGMDDFFIEGLVVPTGLLPLTTTDKLTAANAIKITLHVDGVDVIGYIPNVANAAQWKAGENYIYTITVNGTELIVDQSVNILKWGDVPASDVGVN